MRFMNNPRTRAVVAIVVLFLATIYPLWRRHSAESKNLAVSLGMEYEALESLAAGQNIPADEAAKKVRSAGIDALVLGEETVSDLIVRGDLNLVTTSVAELPSDSKIRITSLIINDPSVLPRVIRGLNIRFGPLVSNTQPRNGRLSLGQIPPSMVRSTSIGLNPEQAAFTKENNFRIVARAGNPTAANANTITATIDWMAEYGVIAFLPLGDQVLGRRELLKTTSEALKAKKIPYASAEFAKIAGDANMLELSPENVIRLHTAQLAELDKLPDADVVDRYVKAARERSHRILLLRPPTSAAAEPLDHFANLIQKVAEGVREEGLVISTPHPFVDPELPGWYTKLLAVIGALVSTLLIGVLVPKLNRIPLIGLGLVLVALSITKTGASLVTLLVSVLLPVLGFWLFADREAKVPGNDGLPGILARVFGTSVISLIGGLYVAASVTGIPYMIRADEFSGVKVAVFLPIVIVGLWCVFRNRNPKEILAAPITYGAVFLGIVLAGVLGVLLARTGNDGLGASGIEILFRNYLDRVLYVRPRTKEFLIGHPVAVIAFGWLLTRKSGLLRNDLVLALTMALAAIGQTGIVNTLCHGHIPIQLSLVRLTLGLAIGSMIGVGGWVAIKRWLPSEE